MSCFERKSPIWGWAVAKELLNFANCKIWGWMLSNWVAYKIKIVYLEDKNFRGLDKIWRAKKNLAQFSNFHENFGQFSFFINISWVTSKVRFCGYRPNKFVKSRKFLPLIYKVIEWWCINYSHCKISFKKFVDSSRRGVVMKMTRKTNYDNIWEGRELWDWRYSFSLSETFLFVCNSNLGE